MKITKIEQVLELAEALNKVHEATNVNSTITIDDLEENGLRELAKQENCKVFEACEMVPYLFIDITLGSIDFILRGKTKSN